MTWQPIDTAPLDRPILGCAEGNMDRVEVYANYEMWRRGVEFRLFDRKTNKHAAEITWADYEEGTRTEPLIVFDGTQAQKLMDQLWDCGIRPTAGAGSAGAMAATERHLEDLRRLVFEKPTKDRI